MKYSIIYLNYDPENIKEWTSMTRRLVHEKSVYDDYEFIEIKDVKGYVNAVNEGLRQAKGEYMIVLNDDVVIEDEDWLKKLAVPNAITSWRKNIFYLNQEPMLDGACWCVPRNIYETIGGMDKVYENGYGCDEIDYFYTAKKNGFELLDCPVKLKHMENKTYSSKYFKESKEAMTERNVSIFYNKWAKELGL